MDFIIHNTLSGQKEVFAPLDPDHVRMYVCGPTVYDRAHIGNARPVVVFDVLYRFLKTLYPRVTYVRNITDIDDKIIEAAAANGESIATLTRRTERIFHEDSAALLTLAPDIEPRATEHIGEMIAMIAALIERNCAYVAEGHVLFDVAHDPSYGAFASRNREDMVAGARVEIASYKKDPADFVLWKPAPDSAQPGWDSPWGRGRPGWHIECSAMAETHLGDTFDLHGGGQDLIFPHHQNEIAQSGCAHDGAPLARYWMHNGYVVVDGEKMSKSLGNFFTIGDLLDEAPGEALRFCILGAHYRQPLDWTRQGLKAARAGLDRLYRSLREVATVTPAPVAGVPPAMAAALCDDLNTPAAIAVLHELAGALNRAQGEERAVLKGMLLAGGASLGLLQDDPEIWFHQAAPSDKDGEQLSDAKIETLLTQRAAARAARDFAKADRIRQVFADHGIILEDKAGATTWRREG